MKKGKEVLPGARGLSPTGETFGVGRWLESLLLLSHLLAWVAVVVWGCGRGLAGLCGSSGARPAIPRSPGCFWCRLGPIPRKEAEGLSMGPAWGQGWERPCGRKEGGSEGAARGSFFQGGGLEGGCSFCSGGCEQAQAWLTAERGCL